MFDEKIKVKNLLRLSLEELQRPIQKLKSSFNKILRDKYCISCPNRNLFNQTTSGPI
jgi:hypothetical protein